MQTSAPPRPALAGSAAAARSAELKREATTWLVLALASSICCASLAIGIGGAVFCYLAMQAADHGQVADAELKLKWGKILTLAGSVLGLSATAISLLLRA